MNDGKLGGATWKRGTNIILRRRAERKMLSSMPLHGSHMKIHRSQDSEGQRGN